MNFCRKLRANSFEEISEAKFRCTECGYQVTIERMPEMPMYAYSMMQAHIDYDCPRDAHLRAPHSQKVPYVGKR